LTTHSADDWAPSITQTSDGNIWVAWHSFRTGSSDVFYKTYNGTAWSNYTQLTYDGGVDGLPSIIQTNDGKIMIFWTTSRTGNYEIFYKNSSDGGSSWSSATQLTFDSNDDRGPAILKTADGKLWLFWQSKRTGDFNVFYKNSSDGGSSWSSATQLTFDSNIDKQPAITQANDGTIWLAWSSNRTGNDDVFYKTSSDNASSWSTETQLTSDLNIDMSPSVMQTDDGNTWIVWQTDINIQDDIYYKVYNGSSWSSENKLTWFMDLDITPSIFQLGNGTICFAWSSDKADNFDVFYKSVIFDIAIKNVTTSATSVPQGDSVNIYVEIFNEGTAGATFNVTAYANETAIGTQTKTQIPSFLPILATFNWNTTTVAIGEYTISAQVDPVLHETDIADNVYVDDVVTVGIHDVAVKNVVSTESLVHRGYTNPSVYVEVANEGTFTETFDVTVYYNSTIIGTQTVSLSPGANTTRIFPWDVTQISYGNYIISAEASIVQDETDLDDNSLTDGTVVVTIPGDVNGDRTVNIVDAGVISAHWYPGPPAGPLGYDLDADINRDGSVDIFDAAIANLNWQKSW